MSVALPLCTFLERGADDGHWRSSATTHLCAMRRSPRSSRDGSRDSTGDEPGEPRTASVGAVPDKGNFWREQLMLPPPEGHQLGSPRRAYQSKRGSPQRGVTGSPGVGFLVSSLVAGACHRRRRICIPARLAQQLTIPSSGVKHGPLLRQPTRCMTGQFLRILKTTRTSHLATLPTLSHFVRVCRLTARVGRTRRSGARPIVRRGRGRY